MIRAKGTLIGQLNNAIVKAYPELENIEIIPSNDEQIFTHENSYGYDKVVVKPIEGGRYAPQQISFRDYTGTDLSYETEELDTSNMTSMSEMFYTNKSLTKVDVGHFNTSNVTDMQRVFYRCENLTDHVDISSWDTSNVTNMFQMFYGCKNLENIDVSNFDTSNVTNIRSMFSGCTKVKTLDVSKWDTSRVTSLADAAYGGPFKDCNNVEELDVSNWVIKVSDYSSVFQGCHKIKTLDLSKWDTSNATRFSSMFDNCRALESLDVSHFDVSNMDSFQGVFSYCHVLSTLKLFQVPASCPAKSWASCFNYCRSLKELDLTDWVSDKVTNLQNFCANCGLLERIVMPNVDGTNLTNVGFLFDECTSLKYIDIRNLHFTQITNYTYYRDAFSNVPSDCEIIVADDAERNWIKGKFSKLTNIKTVAELEVA